MGLDKTIARIEAERASEAQAVADNRAAIDAACVRFSELAAKEGLEPTFRPSDDRPDARPFWIARINGGSNVHVFEDGTWDQPGASSLRPDRDAGDVEEALALMILDHRARQA